MARASLCIFVTVNALFLHCCAGYKFPFQDPSLPWDKRVDDLVGRLSLQEIAEQTMAIYNSQTPPIPRLEVGSYQFITECLRGEAGTNNTAFPQSVGLAASFSPELIFNMTTVVSTEIHAVYNSLKKAGVSPLPHGLSCFSPVINIMRHPLWGRNQETYGEDPFLSGSLVTGYVKGLQGDHPRYVRANAGCKHFDVHGGPENIPVSRMSFDAKVSMRDWRMTFLPQFKMCVEAGSYNLMCSYNSINGIPSCANKLLLTDITRKEWGFKGYIVSDDLAISNIQTQHHYVNSSVEVVAVAIKAGCNLELGTHIYNSTVQAVKEGKLTEQEVRDNVKPLMYMRMRLGEFDPPEMNPYNTIDTSVIQSEAHRELAIEAAVKSFVMLKYTAPPIAEKHPNILYDSRFNILHRTRIPMLYKMAVVGPLADNVGALYGDYAAQVTQPYAKSPFEGLKPMASMPVAAPGCTDVTCSSYNSSQIQSAVQGSDLVVICIGLSVSLESEGHDRSSLDLPGKQLDLLKEAAMAGAATGAFVVVLVFNAGPLDVSWAKTSDSVDVMIWCGYPAQATGDALYRVFTMTEIPAGRLPATWPASLDQVGSITDYSMTNKTYRYFNGDPLYPFGYGLSASTFKYLSMSLSSPRIQPGQEVTVTTTVQNMGPYDADEVVQVYMSWMDKSIPAPKIQLVGFRRVFIKYTATVKLDFTIKAEQMAVWMDDTRGFVVPPGTMKVCVGGQQPNQKTAVPSNVLSDQFVIAQ